jgi:EAL domain-containing protein (putative c-di-GMP-specific phosphodiesterase class I)
MAANSVPDSIGLELTESMVMTADVSTVMTLQALTDLGIRLNLDDFGTG